MIDLANEKLLTLSQAAELLPKRPSLPTWWRWRKKGCRGRRLETISIGGRVYTSAEALARFAEHGGGAPNAPSRSPSRREREIFKASQALDEALNGGSCDA